MDCGHDKLEYLQRFLLFKHGMPSPDILRRVMELLSPEQFLKGFMSWAEEIKKRSSCQIYIDGKTLCGTIHGVNPLHIVSAWIEQNRIVLGALKTDAKSNEIPTLEALLDLLVLNEGDIVTIDVIG